VRKVVTVLFCDLTGSTALGERTDPETLRKLMRRYYETARVVLERHGGTVEKFVGDAVMAVFGIPVAREDDALRATRAAVELRDVVQELGLDARIGVNTGPVVAGEGDTLVTGDAVNVAARLEQSAAAGEILLGDDTLSLVRDAVAAHGVELSVKGKSGVIRAHRVVALDSEAAGVARNLERRIVGRARERGRLRADFADVVAGPACRLFTLIGPAGIGKSRLVADFLEDVAGSAAVAGGRALSYGEGITYWPLVEMLIQLGVEPSDVIRSSPAETQLAARVLLEHRATERPLVLVVDDLQWAEAPMLDLVEHVVDWSRDAPIFVVCIARPELLDVRPGWGGGKLNATSVLLEPLSADEAHELAEEVLGDRNLDPETRERILATAAGNPLFLEEMAALAHEARGAVDVPPTIRALLQARLDTLNDGELTVIQRGAVEGQVFHRGAIAALAPSAPVVDVPQQLVALVRKELVRPDAALIAGDDAFRFRHLLIRDAAYEGLPKSVRAELHARFAEWLDANATLVEQDEIVGYHLEQAARFTSELDAADPTGEELARRAAERLGAAGIEAFEREDLHATRSLLTRALGLVSEGPLRRRLIPPLVDARLEANDVAGLVELVEEMERGDERDRAIAVMLRALVEPAVGSGRPFAELGAALDEAQAVLEAAGDLTAAARCERARAMVAWAECAATRSYHAMVRCRELLRQAGSNAFGADLVSNIPPAAIFAGRPLHEVATVLDELERDADDAGPLLAASLRATRARVEFGSGRRSAAETRATVVEYSELLRQVGSALEAEVVSGFLGVLALMEGDEEFERVVRARVERLDALGDRMYLVSTLAEWATSLCALGDADAASAAVARGRELLRHDDLADRLSLDAAEAYVRALAGDREGAERLLENVHEVADHLDMAMLVDRLRHIEASVRTVLGDVGDARTILEELAASAERRGFVRILALYERDLAMLAESNPD
jgi:class 3 adenylate cyclase